jgi:hypothetical protein
VVAQGHAIAAEVRHQLLHHVLHLANAVIHVDPLDASGEEHHHVVEHVYGDLPAYAQQMRCSNRCTAQWATVASHTSGRVMVNVVPLPT